jgi:hypothetical protein
MKIRSSTLTLRKAMVDYSCGSMTVRNVDNASAENSGTDTILRSWFVLVDHTTCKFYGSLCDVDDLNDTDRVGESTAIFIKKVYRIISFENMDMELKSKVGRSFFQDVIQFVHVPRD